MAGILASWFIPDIPHPVLILHGEPSTGKSTTTRRLKELVDPSVVPVLAMPKRAIDAYQQLDHHWVAPFDNVSALSDDMSDLLCRAVTGEGTSTRVLYTNDGDYIRRYRRCIAINGVGNPVYRADLLDRAVIIETSPIANPRDERSLDGAWLEARAGILGAVFDAVSEGMRTLSSVNLPRPPRMADFARWGMAFAPALGYTARGFIDDYTAANRRRWQDVIDGSPFARALVALVTRQSGAWSGTATELLREVRTLADKKDAACIPDSAKGVSTELDRLAAALRRIGVFAERKREGKDGQRIIVLTTDAQWELC
jgi:hypothetical protein